MTKFVLSILLAGLLIFCFSQEVSNTDPASLLHRFLAADHIYEQARQTSLQSGDEARAQAGSLYKQALSGYLTLIPEAKSNGYDSLNFFAHLRAGYIYYYFDSLAASKDHYGEAINTKKSLPAIADSFLFKPFFLTGNIFYTLNKFDSALVYYQKAEQINAMYDMAPEEMPALYDRLGLMYYQNGNYGKAKDYFEKAISLSALNRPENKELLDNYRISIGSILIKLEEFEQARLEYESILPNKKLNNEIYYNLGIIDLRLGNYTEAIESFRRVHYGNDKKNIDLFYNFSMAFSALNKKDSSGYYFDRAIQENAIWNGKSRNASYGLLLKFHADELADSGRYYEAIQQYQQAIVQFDNDFDSLDIYTNPSRYNGIISYADLFNTLIAKADAFENLQKNKNIIRALGASLNAYRAAFLLADFVEKTYESAEAGLFLDKIKSGTYSKLIAISLKLFDLTHQPHYLEEAYRFDQLNKAYVLSQVARENKFGSSDTASRELLQQESTRKSVITRLSLQAATTTDSTALRKINESFHEQEAELRKTQQQIHEDPVWKKKHAAERIPAITDLQKMLDGNTAILTFHLLEHELLTFVITAKEFSYNRAMEEQSFFDNIDSMKLVLYDGSDHQEDNSSAGMALYRQLIIPVHAKLSSVSRLIIIPDDKLTGLPFEALQDENKNYLLEEFSVQYQYSASLLEKKRKPVADKNTLALAPFTTATYQDSSGDYLNALSSSKEEVSHAEGLVLTGSAATKSNFCSLANKYNVLHLATHARVNDKEPSRSFIAFYPGADFKLTSQEIYDLKLDSTQLVILSSCEAVPGQSVKAEGMMNLSAAFTYAGCPNMIASLWKAEDKATSFLVKRLYYYLDNGYTSDRALQQAKLDLLHDDDIELQFKTPANWAHLVFTGQYERSPRSIKWLLISVISAIAVVIVILIARGRYYY